MINIWMCYLLGTSLLAFFVSLIDVQMDTILHFSVKQDFKDALALLLTFEMKEMDNKEIKFSIATAEILHPFLKPNF